MTISVNDRLRMHDANGVTTSFAYDFLIAATSEVRVTYRDADGVDAVKTLGTHYTVTGAGNPSGGNVVFSAAPATGGKVIIEGVTPLTQTTNWATGSTFPAESHEAAADKVIRIAQELRRDLDGTLRFRVGQTMTAIDKVEMAGSVLGFDLDGEPIAMALVNSTQPVHASWLSKLLAPLTDFVSAFMATPLMAATAHAFAKAVDGHLTLQTVAAMRALTSPAGNVSYEVTGIDAAHDFGGGSYRWDAASTATHNGVSVVSLAAGGTGRFLRVQGEEFILAGGQLDGVNDHVEMNRLTEFAYRCGRGLVRFSGGFNVAGTIVAKQRVSLDGFGLWFLSRTGDYGDTIQMGEASSTGNAFGQYCHGFWAWHRRSYTAGVTTTLENPVTPHDSLGLGDAHVRIFNGRHVSVKGSCWNLPFGVVNLGGFKVKIDIDTVGVWDHVEAGLREGVAGIAIFKDPTSGAIPTDVHIDSFLAGGYAAPPRTVNFGGGTADKTNFVEDIGPKYGVWAKTYERLYITGYIGGQNEIAILVEPTDAAIGLYAMGMYIDGTRLSHLCIRNGNAEALSTCFAANVITGGDVTLHSFDIEARSGAPTARNLHVTGNTIRSMVGTPFMIRGAVGVTITGNTIHDYNCYKLSLTDTTFCAAGLIVGAGSGGVASIMNISGNVVGSLYETPASSNNPAKFGFIFSGTGDDPTIECRQEANTWCGRTDGGFVGGDLAARLVGTRVSSTAELTDITHAINTSRFKVLGAGAWNLSATKDARALGATAGAIWVTVDAANVYTPV